MYISDEVGNGAVRILQAIMVLAAKYNFTNITKIFQANVGVFFGHEKRHDNFQYSIKLTIIKQILNQKSPSQIKKVPILKFTDAESDVEVDFGINNRLGVRNSLLLQQYCAIDERVQDIGRLVKAWAKKKDLVGTADGFLNSYAYM